MSTSHNLNYRTLPTASVQRAPLPGGLRDTSGGTLAKRVRDQRVLTTSAASGFFFPLAQMPLPTPSLSLIVGVLLAILLGAMGVAWAFARRVNRLHDERTAAASARSGAVELINFSSRGNSSPRGDASTREHWPLAGADTPAEIEGLTDSSTRAGARLEPACFIPEVLP